MKQAIILANGEFPKREDSLKTLRNAETLICCDGAYSRLVCSGVCYGEEVQGKIYVVGDGDSLDGSLRHNPPFPTLFVEGYTDQECNDLTKAVRFAVTLGVTAIDIYGATGLREDHALGNISLLVQYAAMRGLDGTLLKVRMITDHGTFLPLSASACLSSFQGQQVSLFSLSPDTTLSVEGLKYPIQKRKLRWWWEATLNEALGQSFRVILHEPGWLLVYQTHDAKQQ